MTTWAAPAADLAGALADRVLDRTRRLVTVPSPPGEEAARAAMVSRWWTADGLAPTTDAVGNVWARLRTGARGASAVVVAAHLDTVFDPSIEHVARLHGDRLCGPSVGDDSVAVAALSALDDLIGAGDGRGPDVWILATVGEEGRGDLRGARFATANPPVPIGAFLAIEGNYLGRIGTVGVGSVRDHLEITGPGGHAWERATAPGTIDVATELIARVRRAARPDAPGVLVDPGRPKSTVNVGSIHGGEAINARAIRTSVEIDLRADDPVVLAELDATLTDALADLAGIDGIDVTRTDIGRRPAGRIDHGHPLVVAAVAGLDAVGRLARHVASSTDANAAHAAGIPAVALGITVGEGEHTTDEWIEVGPIGDGLRALAVTIDHLRALEDT